jgi:hypothetical protein
MVAFIGKRSFAQNDSVVIKRIRVIPDTIISGVRGIGISYVSSLVYDTIFHMNKRPTSLYLVFSLTTKGKAVECMSSSSKYCKNREFKYRRSLSSPTGDMTFLPFYELNLPEGEQTVDLTIDGLMSDTSIFDRTLKPILLVGERKHRISFRKPPVEQFSVLVSGVRALNTDFKGKQWDYNLLSGSSPDICWSVTIGSGDSYNTLYRSSVMKNAYSAAWIDWAEEVVVSQGDRICVAVYDDDLMSDDLIGSICGSLSDIVLMSQKKQPLVFDRLSYFTFMINRIK